MTEIHNARATALKAMLERDDGTTAYEILILRQALLAYGGHDPGCDHPQDHTCACGFTDFHDWLDARRCSDILAAAEYEAGPPRLELVEMRAAGWRDSDGNPLLEVDDSLPVDETRSTP